MPVFLIKYHSVDQVEKNEIGWHVACMGKRRGAYRVWSEDLRVRNHLKDIGVEGRIILKRSYEV